MTLSVAEDLDDYSSEIGATRDKPPKDMIEGVHMYIIRFAAMLEDSDAVWRMFGRGDVTRDMCWRPGMTPHAGDDNSHIVSLEQPSPTTSVEALQRNITLRSNPVLDGGEGAPGPVPPSSLQLRARHLYPEWFVLEVPVTAISTKL
jgi:hypothetical protein